MRGSLILCEVKVYAVLKGTEWKLYISEVFHKEYMHRNLSSVIYVYIYIYKEKKH